MKNIYLIFFMLLWMFSCNDPYENTTYTAFEELPAATFLSSQPENYEMWTALLDCRLIQYTKSANGIYAFCADKRGGKEISATAQPERGN